MTKHALIALVGFLAASLPARGQAVPEGITVQLPTFSVFGVMTTISVPDSGRGFLGGRRYVSSGNNHFGGPLSGGRSRGRAAGANQLHVSATIHDFERMERELLGDDSSSSARTANKPAGSNPAGSNPAGSNPAGSNPAGSNPAGSNPAGSGSSSRASRLVEQRAENKPKSVSSTAGRRTGSLAEARRKRALSSPK